MSRRRDNTRTADVTKTAAERSAEHLEAVRAVHRQSHLERLRRRIVELRQREGALGEEERRQLAALRAELRAGEG